MSRGARVLTQCRSGAAPMWAAKEAVRTVLLGQTGEALSLFSAAFFKAHVHHTAHVAFSDADSRSSSLCFPRRSNANCNFRWLETLAACACGEQSLTSFPRVDARATAVKTRCCWSGSGCAPTVRRCGRWSWRGIAHCAAVNKQQQHYDCFVAL